jgi:hypothetical protein
MSLVGSLANQYSSRWLQAGSLVNPQHPSGCNRAAPGIPTLVKTSTSKYVVSFDLCTNYWFDGSGLGPTYPPLYGAEPCTLTFDSSICKFRFCDCLGNACLFTPQGVFYSHTPSLGPTTSVMAYTSSGQVARISRFALLDGDEIEDFNEYDYFDSGENSGKVKQVVYGRKRNPTVDLRRMAYTYYEAGDLHGTTGDLKTAVEQILDGTTWVDHETTYFRYYLDGDAQGFEHGLKYVLGNEAFHQALNDPQIADPLLATDSQLAPYNIGRDLVCLGSTGWEREPLEKTGECVGRASAMRSLRSAQAAARP